VRKSYNPDHFQLVAVTFLVLSADLHIFLSPLFLFSKLFGVGLSAISELTNFRYN